MTPYDRNREQASRIATRDDRTPLITMHGYKCRKCKKAQSSPAGRKKAKGGEGWICKGCATKTGIENGITNDF